jgi:hypothetical protein
VVEVAAWIMKQALEAGWVTERELIRDELSRARDLDGVCDVAPDVAPTGCWSERAAGPKQCRWS